MFGGANALVEDANDELAGGDIDVAAQLRMAATLHRLGRHDDGARATARYQELKTGLKAGHATELIEQLRSTSDINERAKLICDLVYSLDPAVPPILHAFIGEVAHDRKTGRHGSGNTFWSAVASIMVRFGMADFMAWYTDGPAPSERWLTEDVDRYLKKHRHPHRSTSTNRSTSPHRAEGRWSQHGILPTQEVLRPRRPQRAARTQTL